jgi:hypothetical protein
MERGVHPTSTMTRSACIALVLAILSIAAPAVQADPPWSGTFTYGARGGNGSATAGASSQNAWATANSLAGPSYGFGYGFGLAQAGNGHQVRAVAVSGIPTAQDREKVSIGVGMLEMRQWAAEYEAKHGPIDREKGWRDLQRWAAEYEAKHGPIDHERVERDLQRLLKEKIDRDWSNGRVPGMPR